MTRRKSFIIFLILIAINLLNCDKSLQNKDQDDRKEENNNTNSTNQRIVVEFTTSIVQHEYIIHFKNYYKKDTRRNYITSALDNPEVREMSKNSILITDNDYFFYRSKIGQ